MSDLQSGLEPVLVLFEPRDGFLHCSLFHLKGAAVDTRRGVPSADDRFSDHEDEAHNLKIGVLREGSTL